MGCGNSVALVVAGVATGTLKEEIIIIMRSWVEGINYSDYSASNIIERQYKKKMKSNLSHRRGYNSSDSREWWWSVVP